MSYERAKRELKALRLKAIEVGKNHSTFPGLKSRINALDKKFKEIDRSFGQWHGAGGNYKYTLKA